MQTSPQIDNLRKRVEQFPDNELFRFSLGKAIYDQKDYKGALEQFEVALKRKPDWMLVAILMGRCWLTLGNKEKAKQSFLLGQKLAREQNHEDPLQETTNLLKELENP